MSAFSHFTTGFTITKFYFKLTFKNMSESCDYLFSQKDFDQTYCGGFLSWGRKLAEGFVHGSCHRGGLRGVNELEPFCKLGIMSDSMVRETLKQSQTQTAILFCLYMACCITGYSTMPRKQQLLSEEREGILILEKWWGTGPTF